MTSLANKYQYIANVQAAGLRNHTSKLVALIVPELTHRGFADFAKALELRLRALGYHLLISCSEDDTDVEACALKALVGQQVDAIVTVSCQTSDEVYHAVTGDRTPIIMVDRKIPDSDYSYIISNDLDTSLQLTALLLEKSRRPPVYFGGVKNIRNSQNRLLGYREILSRSDIEVDESLIFHQNYTAEAGYDMMSSYFHQHQALPENLLTASFTLMEGVLGFVREHFNYLPEQINWATFGNSMILDLLPFSIQSAAQDYTSMADHTIDLLVACLTENAERQEIILSREIIKRKYPII